MALVEAGLARSRNQAAALIDAGRVLVRGVPARKASQPIEDIQGLQVLDAQDYVSRAGHKLANALHVFSEIEVVGKTALDIGASTGGFTDVLLRRGAALVFAIDVGHDQLVAELRANRRVVAIEGFNARELSLQSLGSAAGREIGESQIGIVVADLSFISLTLVLEQAFRTAPLADFVLLIKPQFEVGKQSLSANGIVNDHRLRAFAIRQVVECAHNIGLSVHGLVRSDLPGTHGNVEYLIWLSAKPEDHAQEWDSKISSIAKETL